MVKKQLFKFKPTKELFVVLALWILVVAAFYLSFQVITTQRVAGQFITFGILGITILGIAVPAVFNTLVKKRPLSSLGITKEKLWISIGLCIVLSMVQYILTLGNISLPDFQQILPLITMSLAVGLFENIFFRGFVQLRMEESFGVIPGIISSAAIYSLYHIGYGMNWSEMTMLFLIGLVYSGVFRLTKNILILFPFLTPMGGLFANIKDGLRIPFEAIYGFADVIFLAVMVLVIVNKIYKKTNKQAEVMGRNHIR